MAAGGGILRRIGIALGVDVEDKEAKAGIESIKSFAQKALGTIAIGVSIVKVSALANEFGAVNAIIKNATRNLGDQAAIQNKILEAANLTKSSYEDTARVVSALVQENTELFGNIDEALKFNNAATELFKTAGKTDDQIAGLMEAINKSFAKGVVDSETISQLLEQSPEAVSLLEKKLGATKEQFEQMASDGSISLKDLKEAFTDSADEIESRFLEAGTSIGDALKNIRNQWGLYIAEIWSGAGVSQRVGKLMVRAFSEFMQFLRKGQPAITSALNTALNWLEKIADMIMRGASFLGRLIAKIGGAENALKLAAVAAAAIWIAFHAKEIIGFLAGMPGLLAKAFSPSGLKTTAIVAAIMLIILAVEDFINFMQGNKSVIGTVLEAWGIDTDQVRGKIIDAWNNVKSFLLTIWNGLKNGIHMLGQAFRDFFSSAEGQKLLESAWKALAAVIRTAGNIIKAVIEMIGTIGTFVFQTLVSFWETFGSTIMAAVNLAFQGIATALEGIAVVVEGVCSLISAIINGDWAAAWNALVQIAQGVWQVIVGVVTTALGSILASITTIFGLVWSTITTWLDNIGSSVSSGFKNVASLVISGMQSAISYLTGLPSQALTWGRDFIDGFAKGIKEKIQGVVESVKGLGSTIRSYLHFSRPDEGPLKDYETWMPDFIDGLSRTLKESRPKIAIAAGSIAAALDIKPSIKTTRNAVGVNKAGNTVNQKVEINNTVHTSDKNVGKEASKQMDKSSNDITKQITKGLAYGRP